MPQIQSTQFLLTPEPNVTYSACLMHKVEQMFETGAAPYPVERTLLVSGMLESCLTSKVQDHARLETPHLSVAYKAPAAIAVRAGLAICDSTDELFPIRGRRPRRPGGRQRCGRRRSGRCAGKLPHARATSISRPTRRRVLVHGASRHGGPQLSGSTDSRSAHGHSFAVERSDISTCCIRVHTKSST